MGERKPRMNSCVSRTARVKLGLVESVPVAEGVKPRASVSSPAGTCPLVRE